MAFDTADLITGLRASRRHFLKHLDGLTDAQWDWKPYPECKSIRETLSHLVADDRAALQALESGGEPDYERLIEEAEAEAAQDPSVTRLRGLLEASHERLCRYIQENLADAPMDAEVSSFGAKMKLGSAIPHLSSEDFYHAGQVAYIRMATDPSWNYYAFIYG